MPYARHLLLFSGQAVSMRRHREERHMVKMAGLMESLRLEWKKIHENGGPVGSEVTDGYLLNGIRMKMLETAEKAKEGGNAWEGADVIPPRVPETYMAREQEVREYAAVLLETVYSGEPYKKLTEARMHGGKRCIRICRHALGPVELLANAVGQDDVGAMRCHAQPEEIYRQMQNGVTALACLHKKQRRAEIKKMARGQVAGQYSIYDLPA